jgi:23S rRNA pseudouridine2605 synthase
MRPQQHKSRKKAPGRAAGRPQSGNRPEPSQPAGDGRKRLARRPVRGVPQRFADPEVGAGSPKPVRRRPDAGPAAPDATSSVKLQKRLAESGMGSRRAMEELIESGQVTVNGRVAKLGARVTIADEIAVAGKVVGRYRLPDATGEPQILLYHKPEGEIVSRSDPEGRPSVFDRVPVARRGRWVAVGRLDYNTCGLLIFTDSGELANRLTHPRYRARRDYAVRLVGELSAEQMHRLRTGITLDDGPARFDVVEAEGGEGTNRWYRVRVREGRNRLVRRMFAALGFTVSRLMRTAFGPFELPSRVKRGHWLKLESREVQQALQRLEREEAQGVERPKGPRAVEGPRVARAAKSPQPTRERAREPGRRPAPGGRKPTSATARASAETPRRPRRPRPAR